MNNTVRYVEASFPMLYNYVSALFEGVKDKGGNPYIEHIEAVVEGSSVESYRAMVIALFHDVLEDTDVSPADLLQQGVTETELAGIKLMTRPEGMTYTEYINRILVSGDRDVMVAKLSDVCSNLDESRLVDTGETRWNSLKVRYEHTKDVLIDSLGEEIYLNILQAQLNYKTEMKKLID